MTAMISGVKCNKCKNILPPHNEKEHFDEAHIIHQCPHIKHCCDVCYSFRNLVEKNCGKLEKPVEVDGDIYNYAWVSWFCNKCISNIDLNNYKPQNT